MSRQSRTGIAGIGTVAVPVTDQDRAVEFYVGTLGLDLRMDTPVEQLGGRWIVVAPPAAVTTIALQPASEARPAGVETGIRLTTGDAAALHAELRERGVDVGELMAWPGVPPMFTFRDPDGNTLVVVE